MPYIKKDNRIKYDKMLNKFPNIETKGDLEYCVFKLMKVFMKTRSFRYSILHEVVYAVMHCADEYRRRFLDRREESALVENGDVEIL